DAVVRHQNVRRLEVAVNQTRYFARGVLHAEGNVQAELNRVDEIEALVIDPAFQIRPEAFRAADVFEDDMRASGDVLDQPRLHDMPVFFQMNPGCRFLKKTGDRALVIEETPLKTLDGDRFAVFVVIAEVDDAHAATPQIGDFVAAFDALANPEFVARVFNDRLQGGSERRANRLDFRNRVDRIRHAGCALEPGLVKHVDQAALRFKRERGSVDRVFAYGRQRLAQSELGDVGRDDGRLFRRRSRRLLVRLPRLVFSILVEEFFDQCGIEPGRRPVD